MGFINEKMAFLWQRFIFPLIRLLWIPHLGGKNFSFVVLQHTSCVCRKSLIATSVPKNPEFIKHAVFQNRKGKCDFPISAGNFFQFILFLKLPVRKITVKEDSSGIWSMLPEYPVGVSLMQTVKQMVVDTLFKHPFPVSKF